MKNKQACTAETCTAESGSGRSSALTSLRSSCLTLTLIATAAYYLIWRLETVNWMMWWIGLPLLVAELFSVVNVLGLLYTTWPRAVPALDVQADPSTFPIFILIPTVNEGAEVLKPTLEGALAARRRYTALHEQAKVEIVLCNDGKVAGVPEWQEIEDLAAQYGVMCLTRTVKGGAKAGNIEHARQEIGAIGEALIVVFDADMVAEPEFLVQTIPSFADPTVGWVQTGQYYRNLDNPMARWSHDQQLFFYRVVCPGKATLNSAFICGTNVVIRAAALDEIGGFPQNSVTEDLAASILLHPRWRGLYIAEVLAQGLGPMDLAAYFTQQRRWAMGTFGVLFRHWRDILLPWHRGLSLPQRLQYLLCCTHYFYGVRDLVCFVAPIAFLCFGLQALKGITFASFLLHFLPYFIVSQGAFWFAAWGRVGIAATVHGGILGFGSFPTILCGLWSAATRQRQGFAVTAKRKTDTRTWRQLEPHLLVLAACVTGLSCFFLGGASPWYGLMGALWVLYMAVLTLGMLWLGVQEQNYPWISMLSSSQLNSSARLTFSPRRLQRVLVFACSLGALTAGVLASQQSVHWVMAERTAPSSYTITELGTLGGDNIFHGGGGLNNSGEIVGQSDTYDLQSRAFLWQKTWLSNPMREMETLPGGQHSTAYAINDSSETIGYAETATGDERAVSWQAGHIHDLGTLPGFRCSVATAINSHGQIVGRAFNPQPDELDLLLWPSHGFLWEKGHMRDLGVLPGSISSRAYGIDDQGEVVGWTLTKNNLRQAFLWKDGQMTALKGGIVSAATGINNRGQIIGISGNSDEDAHAVVWENGQTHDLGTILGHTFNRASAINNKGVIVGMSRTGEETAPPFIWDPAHGMHSLNSLLPARSGWYLTQAFGINDHNQVLAWGQFEGHERMCLLTPASTERGL